MSRRRITSAILIAIAAVGCAVFVRDALRLITYGPPRDLALSSHAPATLPPEAPLAAQARKPGRPIRVVMDVRCFKVMHAPSAKKPPVPVSVCALVQGWVRP